MTGIEAIAEKLTHVQYEGLDMLDGAVDSMIVPTPEGYPAGTELVSQRAEWDGRHSEACCGLEWLSALLLRGSKHGAAWCPCSALARVAVPLMLSVCMLAAVPAHLPCCALLACSR